jgi:hypothetical protein
VYWIIGRAKFNSCLEDLIDEIDFNMATGHRGSQVNAMLEQIYRSNSEGLCF